MAKPPSCIYLSGASWGCAFYIGCFKAFIKRYGHRKMRKVVIHGDSAGAMIGLALVISSPKTAETIYKELARRANKNGVMFKMTKYHNKALDLLLADPNAYKKVNGRLRVGVTLYPNKYKVYDNFESNEHLRHIMHCSFHVPFYTTYPAKIKGRIALDGSFANDLSRIPRSVLIIGVGMNTHEFDICGELDLRTCKYPLLKTKYKEVVADGYSKAMAWENFSRHPMFFPLPVWWFVRILEIPFLKDKRL
jgi:hypothetical protein